VLAAVAGTGFGQSDLTFSDLCGLHVVWERVAIPNRGFAVKLALSAVISVALLFGCASGQHVWNQSDAQPVPKIEQGSPSRSKRPQHVRTEYAHRGSGPETHPVKAPLSQTAQVDFF
jgi:hypothetical protein